jgi:hypothetical protein
VIDVFPSQAGGNIVVNPTLSQLVRVLSLPPIILNVLDLLHCPGLIPMPLKYLYILAPYSGVWDFGYRLGFTRCYREILLFAAFFTIHSSHIDLSTQELQQKDCCQPFWEPLEGTSAIVRVETQRPVAIMQFKGLHQIILGVFKRLESLCTKNSS